jgi:hypothetical protein
VQRNVTDARQTLAHRRRRLALTGTAAAQDARPRFEISPFVGYRTGGEFEVDDGNGETDSVDLDDDASFGVDLGLYRDGNSFYELLYSRQEAGVDSSVPVCPVSM